MNQAPHDSSQQPTTSQQTKQNSNQKNMNSLFSSGRLPTASQLFFNDLYRAMQSSGDVKLSQLTHLSPKADLPSEQVVQIHQDFIDCYDYHLSHPMSFIHSQPGASVVLTALRFGIIYLDQNEGCESKVICQLTDLLNERLNYHEQQQQQQIDNENNQVVRPDLLMSMCYNNRASKYDKLGQHARAIEDYNRSIDIEPEFSVFYYNRAWSYEEMRTKKESTDSEDDLWAPLDSTSDSVVDEQSGVHELSTQEMEECTFRDYCNAIRVDPRHTLAHYGRAVKYYHRGQYRLAVRDLSVVIDELEPESAFARSQRSFCLERMDRVIGALRDMNFAVATQRYEQGREDEQCSYESSSAEMMREKELRRCIQIKCSDVLF